MKLMGRLFLMICILFIFQSCGFYSLTGYEISAENASVSFFENQAPIQSVELSQLFTNKLEQKIIRETQLQLIPKDGQLQFSGAITGYSLSPAAVTGVEETEQLELRITVSVTYVDTETTDNSFTENFSATETFDASADLSSVESQLFESITDQLVQSIFNRAFINW